MWYGLGVPVASVVGVDCIDLLCYAFAWHGMAWCHVFGTVCLVVWHCRLIWCVLLC